MNTNIDFFRDKVFQFPRSIKRLISIVIDSLSIVLSFWLALTLSLEKGADIYNEIYWSVITWVVFSTIYINVIFSTFL